MIGCDISTLESFVVGTSHDFSASAAPLQCRWNGLNGASKIRNAARNDRRNFELPVR